MMTSKTTAPIAAVGVLAVGFAKEWFGRDKPAEEEQNEA